MEQGERLNSITHIVGGALAIIGTIVLIVVSAIQGDPAKIISFTIYGTTLICVYVMSALYHGLHGPSKSLFRKLDHLAIYLLIAGTYTPFTIVALRNRTGWIMFTCVWALALAGVAYEFLVRRARRTIPAIIALLMGWMAIFAIGPLARALTTAGLAWVLVGGIFYSVGTIFFALSNRMRHSHGVWHIFVILGSVAHYYAIFVYVALRSA